MTPPRTTARLFTEPSLDALIAGGYYDEISRLLLEDGDHLDLIWLLATIGETRLLAWFERWGTKHLSLRSRAFWALVWNRPLPEDQGRTTVWPY